MSEESLAQQVAALEGRVRYDRDREIRAEQRFDFVIGMLLRGERVCIRCWQPESRHVPGPPTPPHVEGHLGAKENKPGCCNDFLELTLKRWEEGDGTGVAT